ncbi:hypothetical protein Y017_14415 [Alcanivorax sp. 97CO-5]|uniref:hypothetical protein n=1 Tax=unclassified Alcanivorax TaxID=2638842 RepID=UPI0003E7E885|nr:MULTISPECIES: hypothetical protein [unclassified Alcanivorax]EUC69623.1 hypothetical protein Y017_14415 [Alcanivorax sp. 97CO-5]PKG01513.1 hypothetical protein Y019_09270 [Alcanivorax sp. 97CO-6]
MHPIIQYLSNRQELVIRAGKIFYHGGFYDAGHNFEGHSWFAKEQSYAAGYVTWGADEAIARGQTPYLSQFEVQRDLTILLIEGNHVQDLYEVYGRVWNHKELAQDTAENLREVNESAVGLLMAGLDDHLLIDFENTLNIVNSINDIDLIKEIKNA